jgi:hypothetical protein
MAKFDLTKDGYRFQYTSGSYVVVRKADAPLGVPYDMMALPKWANRAHLTLDVLGAIAAQWMEQHQPVGPAVRHVRVLVDVLVAEADYISNYGQSDDIDDYTGQVVRAAAAEQFERFGWGAVVDPIDV